MKNFIYLLLILFIIIACSTTKSNSSVGATNGTVPLNDTIRIANDSLEYEVIIIDNQFSYWLASRAYPRNYYPQSYLENKNKFWINEWNNRVMQPQRYNPNLYEMSINYDSNINYGYEVNYLIYNYLVFFQNTYKQKLGGYVPLQ